MRPLLYLLCILSAATLYSQDCECEIYNGLRSQIGKHFGQGQFDSAQIVLNRLHNNGDVPCEIAYLDGTGQVYIAKKQFPEACTKLVQAMHLIEKQGCLKMKTRNYNTLARYYQELSKHDSVIYFSYKALENAKNISDWPSVIRAQINIGAIYSQNNEHEKALALFQEALQTSVVAKDSFLLASIYTRLMVTNNSLYLLTKKSAYLEATRRYAQEAIYFSKQTNDRLELMSAYISLADYYTNTGITDSVIHFCQKVIAQCPRGKHDFNRLLASAFNIYGKALYEEKKYAQCSVYADSAYRYALLFNRQVSISPLELMYKNAQATGDDKKALFALTQIKAVNDSIFTLEKNKTIHELEQKYNQSRNEKTILQLAYERNILWISLLVAALLGLVLYFYFSRQMLRQKQHILETEQRLNRARMNPHFFFNALASLQSFAVNESDAIVLAENLSKFSHIMRETLENTYREYVTIRQESEFLKEYLELQQMRFPDKFDFALTLDASLDAEYLLIPSMIVQPFVENSVEHGFANLGYKGLININFYTNETGVVITVIDNGKGLNYQSAHSKPYISRASQIIRDRIYLLNLKLKSNAAFAIQNNSSEGVTVTIKLPVIHDN